MCKEQDWVWEKTDATEESWLEEPVRLKDEEFVKSCHLRQSIQKPTNQVWGKKRYLGSKHTPYWENRFFLLFLCSYTSPDTDGYFLHRSASNSGKKNVSVEISLRLLMVMQYIQLRDKLKINTVNCRIKHSKQIYRLILDEQLVL